MSELVSVGFIRQRVHTQIDCMWLAGQSVAVNLAVQCSAVVCYTINCLADKQFETT